MTFDATFADDGKTIEARIGADLLLALPVIGGSGYRWRQEPPASEAVILQEESPAVLATRPGGSLPQVFRLTPQAAGRVALKFILCRAWEEGVKPRGKFRITLRVLA